MTATASPTLAPPRGITPADQVLLDMLDEQLWQSSASLALGLGIEPHHVEHGLRRTGDLVARLFRLVGLGLIERRWLPDKGLAQYRLLRRYTGHATPIQEDLE